jgi:hypothetical protein
MTVFYLRSFELKELEDLLDEMTGKWDGIKEKSLIIEGHSLRII